MFVLTTLEKIKETRLKFPQGSIKVTITNTQLNKVKSAAINKTGKTLRVVKKNFEDEELPH